jgi:hypothetical protein
MKHFASRFVTGAALALVALLALPALDAQTSRVTLKAAIPFEFAAGGQTFASGDYAIEIDSASWRVLFVPANGGKAAYFMPLVNDWATPADGRARLVFHKTAGGYFLNRIVNAGGTRQYEWLPSREERRSAGKGGVEVAVLPLRSDKVSR